MKEELLKGLSEEQIKRIKACRSQEEMLAIAKEEGIELNDEQLEAVNGGCGGNSGLTCPHCGKSDYGYQGVDFGYRIYTCNSCGRKFYQNFYSSTVLAEMR